MRAVRHRECYKYHWEQFAAAGSDEAENKVIARVMWDVVRRRGLDAVPDAAAAVVRNPASTACRISARAVDAVGGAPDLTHGSTARVAPNELPADVVGTAPSTSRRTS